MDRTLRHRWSGSEAPCPPPGPGVTDAGGLLARPAGPYPILLGSDFLDPTEHLLSYEKANLRDVTVLKNSPMPSYRTRLSAEELADVVGYLATLKGRT